jgi:coenzyme PQQ precursor peptide PqqA
LLNPRFHHGANEVKYLLESTKVTGVVPLVEKGIKTKLNLVSESEIAQDVQNLANHTANHPHLMTCSGQYIGWDSLFPLPFEPGRYSLVTHFTALIGAAGGINMEWTTPAFEEVCLNCEINSYASAKL